MGVYRLGMQGFPPPPLGVFVTSKSWLQAEELSARTKSAKTARSKSKRGPFDSVRKLKWADIKAGLTNIGENLGCVTPVQIQNLNKAIENNLEYLDGYAELDPSLQAVVQEALKEGHVDDSDWRGDVEQNRPGVKGVRKTTSKKKLLMEQTEAGADGSHVASRPAQIKRGRGKTVEDTNNGHAAGRSISGVRTASKRSKDNLAKEADAVEPPPKKLKSARKKTKKAQTSHAESKPKPDNDPSGGKKSISQKSSPLIERKEGNSEYIIASPPNLSRRRPRRRRLAISKIGSEEDETDLESNASESDSFVSERKEQRRRKTAGGDLRKNASIRAARAEEA